MPFEYVNHIDAVGTLYQEACTRGYDCKRVGNELGFEKWYAVADALQSAWPDLVAQSLGKTGTRSVGEEADASSREPKE